PGEGMIGPSCWERARCPRESLMELGASIQAFSAGNGLAPTGASDGSQIHRAARFQSRRTTLPDGSIQLSLSAGAGSSPSLLSAASGQIASRMARTAAVAKDITREWRGRESRVNG